VISVSKSMRIISLFIDGARFVLEDSAAILSHATWTGTRSGWCRRDGSWSQRERHRVAG
jgi:hypothetical protein